MRGQNALLINTIYLSNDYSTGAYMTQTASSHKIYSLFDAKNRLYCSYGNSITAS